MTAKRLDRQAIFLAGALLAGVPAMATAQNSGGQWRLPPGTTTGPTKAVQPKAEPQVIIVQPQPNYRRPTVFRRAPHTQIVPGQRSGAVVIPAVLLADGSVYANFGYGYEPVYRSCYSGGVVVGQPLVGEPAVIGSNGVVLSPARPTYTQPVPNQQTASQQMTSQAQGSQRVIVSTTAQSACYNRDGAGRVFVVRF
ncbi:MAG TPA: hypothetical protein VEB19_04295 [Gemmatimonadaceae bacterium]|nr:hypothetical protein [Gemmatimonadaceae bacterium]